MKKWLEKIKAWQAIVAALAATIALTSPFVVKLDNRWVHAETGIKLQETIELQQHTIQQMNDKFAIEIAKLKYENRKEQYNEFVAEHGDDLNVMSPANKIKFLELQDKLEEAEREYENLL